MLRYSGADPGFPVGRFAKPGGRGPHHHRGFVKISKKKYMKWRKFRAVGTPAPTLDPLLLFQYFLFDKVNSEY